MVSVVHNSAVQSLDALEQLKHSTTGTEHVCKIVIKTFALLNVQAAWAAKMTAQLSGMVKVIDATQWIYPIHHFFLSEDYKTSSKAFNVFMGAHFCLSAVDFYDFITESRIVDLGRQAAELGRRFPIFAPVAKIPFVPLLNVGTLVMFGAYAKDSWDKLGKDELRQEERKQALFSLVYSCGIIAVTGLGMVTAHSLVPLSLTVSVVGLVGNLYGSYSP